MSSSHVSHADGIVSSGITVSPAAVGNVLALFVSCLTNDSIVGIAGGGVTTWNFVNSSNNFSDQEIWFGVVTATGSSAITVTWTSEGTAGCRECSVDEFSSGFGAAATWTHVSDGYSQTSSTDTAYPSLTAPSSNAANAVYAAYARVNNDCNGTAAGSASGDTATYGATTGHSNGYCWIADLTNSVSEAPVDSAAGNTTFQMQSLILQASGASKAQAITLMTTQDSRGTT